MQPNNTSVIYQANTKPYNKTVKIHKIETLKRCSDDNDDDNDDDDDDNNHNRRRAR